jgi:DNA invertase Pin-like site-specific DNA recombinase
MTVDRLTAARRTKAAHGGYAHGTPPYGQRSVKGKLVPAPAEQRALVKMKALAAQGVPINEIARVLNAEGAPTKRGGKWCGATVARILKRANKVAAA